MTIIQLELAILMSARIIFKIRNITGEKKGFPSKNINTEKDITMMNVYASINIHT